MTTVTPIDGGGKPDKAAEAVREMRRMMPLIIEQQADIARMRFAAYESHIKAGFNPLQALMIVKDLFK